jgi:hypothetical protein
MVKLSENESSMISVKVYKEDNVKLSILKTIFHFLINIFYGLDTKEFVLTLTDKNLYIDYMEWPGQSDIAFTEKIDRRNIRLYEVRKEGNEIITLLKSKGKPMTFIRDNENSSNLATELAKLLEEQYNEDNVITTGKHA